MWFTKNIDKNNFEIKMPYTPLRKLSSLVGIAIVSLVQAGRPTLGEFLRCPDQNLVALSRAYSLLIVIGDQDLISQEPVWKSITKYRIDMELKGQTFLKLNQAWSKKYLTKN